MTIDCHDLPVDPEPEYPLDDHDTAALMVLIVVLFAFFAYLWRYMPCGF